MKAGPEGCGHLLDSGLVQFKLYLINQIRGNAFPMRSILIALLCRKKTHPPVLLNQCNRQANKFI